MSPTAVAVLTSWRFDLELALPLVATALLYARGWSLVQRQLPAQFPPWRLAAFLAGLALVYVAIASPLDSFAGLLLQVHMAQHLLLMVVAPALILLGAPGVPLLRGLPARFAKDTAGPFLAAPVLRRIAERISHPAVCWFAMAAATWIWHAPGPYQAALRSPFWHAAEHASFLAAGLLFWWPVVQPWPSRARWPEWTMPLYLLLADVQNTALSAILVFSGRLVYPFYASVPRLAGISAESDQITAGLFMWVPMSLLYLTPAAVLTMRLLSPRNLSLPAAAPAVAAAITPRPRLDLLAWPRLGAILRAGATRRLAQGAMLLVALAVVADGFLGPQMSPMNLAGVLPWTYWRAATIAALLVAGNAFCFACPFTLPRALARRLGLEREWPAALRSKWIAVGVLLAFFWAYEVLALWDRPQATALLIVAYFAAAFAVDALFRNAAFCRYVCPIGQFQFVHSLLSPLEVRARQPQTCAGCATQDCLAGGPRGRGCATELLLPAKAGSLDCTFCLDCARACPHDNVGLVLVAPARELWRDPLRSSLGRLSQRLDIAVLALVLVAASLLSAAAMIAPVTRWESGIAARLGLVSTAPIVSALLLAGIGVVPIALLAIGSFAGRALAGIGTSLRELFCRLALALVPLGASIWAAHFLFHLASGWASAVPVLQRAAGDVLGSLAESDWRPPAPWLDAEALLRLEILLLDAGLLLALYSGWRIAGSYSARPRTALALLLPWALMAAAVYAGGVWVFLQPMEMRGMMSH